MTTIYSLNTESTDYGYKLTTKAGQDAGKLEYLPDHTGVCRWVFSYPQVFLRGTNAARIGYSQHSSYTLLRAAEYAAVAWAIDNLEATEV